MLGAYRSSNPSADIGISVSYPLPGTPFFERVKKEMGAKTNWSHSKDLDLMFPGAYTPTFYRALYGRVHREFRLRKDFAAPPTIRRVGRMTRNAVGLLVAHAQLAVLGYFNGTRPTA